MKSKDFGADSQKENEINHEITRFGSCFDFVPVYVAPLVSSFLLLLILVHFSSGKFHDASFACLCFCCFPLRLHLAVLASAPLAAAAL